MSDDQITHYQRIRGKHGMTVHEVYNRDKGRATSRWCKRMLARFRRRIWKQSLEQGFDGEVPTVKGTW